MNPDRARDHLANERTFLAWLRTGIAVAVFGFAIGRFTIAMRQQAGTAGRSAPAPEFSVWFGTAAIIAGVLLTLTGLLRYRLTRRQLDAGQFEPAGLAVDLAGVLTIVFGLALAALLVYIGFRR